MTPKELSELKDEELLLEAKKTKGSPIINALIIGFLIGIIIYGVAVNRIGFFALIPLFFIYLIVKGSKKNETIEQLLKDRNLK